VIIYSIIKINWIYIKFRYIYLLSYVLSRI